MSVLLVEIFRIVLGILSKDKKSLHSCLLVDRTWCERVVSILWNDPFQFLKEPSAELIQTYILCLPESVRANLQESGINLENTPNHKPTFDYAVFLRHLKYINFYESSLVWLEKVMGHSNHRSEGFLVTKELCKLFMNQSPAILSLNINTENLNLPDNIDYVSIPCFPGARKSLSQLQEFMCCGTYDKKKIFRAMSQSCKNIRNLSVDYYLDELSTAAPTDLANLIKSQNALVEFKLVTCSRFLSKIIPALKKQAKTLTNVEFRGVHFEDCVSFEALAACTNLESLIFFHCDNVMNDALEPLSTADFPKLRKIVFHIFHMPPPSLGALICNNNDTLQELLLEWPPLDQEDPKIIEMIIEHCPNIIKFDAHLKTDQLRSLLCALSRLEDLTVHSREPLLADGFLPQLGQLIPPNLRILNVRAIWSFNPESLKQFLDHCIAPLEFIGLRECYALTDEHLEVLAAYAEKGTLKHLNIKVATRITREGLINARKVIDRIDHNESIDNGK
ncbi:hypothetical protein Glove_74g182 [Diversispora epigaea]|uniref:F-box domain-containing protein n=1 Tax=Diversispora epigaea TaxID=1348612 RepID=A0A397J9W5_9GLOM|nr:hypothetical protein Glove_74g182 [Diversispora epigaea]